MTSEELTEKTLAVHCGPSTKVAEALRLMQAGEVDYLVVVEGGRTVGVLTRADLIGRGPGEEHSPVDTVGKLFTGHTAYLWPEHSP